MKKIAWITASSFIDSDIYAVKNLSAYYYIDWYIFHKKGEKLDYADEIKDIDGQHDNIRVNIVNTLQHDRQAGNISIYKKLCRNINKKDYNMIYLCVSNAPYFIPVFCGQIKNRNNVILGIHNVHAPKGSRHSFINKMYTNYAIKHFNNFQTFSESQKNLLASMKNNCNVLCIPFYMKDFGESKRLRVNDITTFLNFGNIRDYKRIDVLINSAERAYELTKIKFRVIIAGSCNNWEKYQCLIKTPELFDIRLGRVNNEDIPDLFNESDYFVAPYQDIAQSGSAIIALNYSKPIIASELEAFKEYVIDGKTGYCIKPANEDDLCEVITNILKTNNENYDKMIENIEILKENKYSDDSISRKYKEYFDEHCK